LHLHGEDVRADLAQDLSAAGIPTQALVAYRQAAQPLSDAAIR
ncbi:MAG: uroporphyrinogen-III synthase, partial [Rhodobacterales bacterium CG_4_10_14_0_8_um_filter_70_9]